MPPPRLSRHLRPCHPSGTAYQVRWASKSACERSLTDGDDQLQSSKFKGNGGSADTSQSNVQGSQRHDAALPISDKQSEKKSWWSATIRNIASFGYETGPAHSGPQHSQPPTAAPISHSGHRAQTSDDELQGRNDGLSQEKTWEEGQIQRIVESSKGEDILSDTSNQRITIKNPSATKESHAEDLLGQKIQSIEEGMSQNADAEKRRKSERESRSAEVRTIQRGHDGESLLITKHISRKGTSFGGSFEQSSTTEQSRKFGSQRGIENLLRKGTQSFQNHDFPRSFTENHSKKMLPEEGHVDMSHMIAIRDMKQQLQQLFEQVKTLQAALDAKDTPEKTVSTSIANSDSSMIPQLSQKSQSEYLGSPFESRKAQSGITRPTSAAPPHMLRSGVKVPPSIVHHGSQHHKRKMPLLGRAWARYRGSTSQLISIADTLQTLSPHVAAPIASSIVHRLRVIARDAISERDTGTKRILSNRNVAIKTLAKEPDSPTGMSVTQTILLTEIPRIPKHTHPSLPVSHAPKKGVKPTLRLIYIQDKEKALGTVVTQTESMALASATRDDGGEAGVTGDNESENQKAAYKIPEKKIDGQRLTRQIHTQSRLMKSSDFSDLGRPTGTISSKQASNVQDSTGTLPRTLPKPLSMNGRGSEQSLLDELFPEASNPQSRISEKREQYPKLELPDSIPIIRRELVDSPITLKEQVTESFQNKGEHTTVLQLVNCSTELTEDDFRRIIPKGKHIESWRHEGDYYRIIPGRDPLSLERLPFYYILFKTPESALAYQKNASRLHKLSALHQPSNIFSAIPPPKGFLEDGEDLNRAVTSYNLVPTHHRLSLNILMQPYNPALRALIERGGYKPIVPDTNSQGKRIWKVLMHIEGHEPTPSDLFKIFRRDAYKHGMSLTLQNESSTSIRRLRDVINLKTNDKPISSARPRAYGSFDHAASQPGLGAMDFEDPGIQSLMAGANEDSSAKEINQMVMNRVYNRWVIYFSDGDAAKRFALSWHRKVLPDLTRDKAGWKDVTDVRICNTEVLW
ncbi:hypothetical protein BKA66DRAFT_250746 [Pyrenochaeta sp. MPI-SDFR-AT-0127]|nr:hypothetical protein BKA66DRAFT_250746 [Pyrenochaeta sp. MPI-SDFR-AT-0127]